ncbi:MAG TPA: hypothetical protein VFW00_13835 [Rhodocyclaceae bacterium]|nr:hypothetical protein [Rhodocyclaceae bacterium]
MTADFKLRKLVNALSNTNKLTPQVGDVPVIGDAILDAVDGYRKKHGGLWVGGVVEITHDGVSFSANALNKAIHTGTSTKHIPLNKIRSVRWEFGWLTGIVVIEYDKGEFRFRCFGAKGVVKRFSTYLASLQLPGRL